MGFSTISANVIFAVAFLGAVGGAVATWFELQHDIPAAKAARDERWNEEISARVDGTFCYHPTTDALQADAVNEGRASVDLEATQLVVDGAVASWATAWVGATGLATSDWAAGENVTLTVTGIADEPERAMLVLPNGVTYLLEKRTCPELTTIVLTPDEASLEVGGSQGFSAAAFDQFGDAWPYFDFAWATQTGTITKTGATTATLAAGTTSGAFTVSATSGGVTGTATVTLSPGAPASVTVSPDGAGVPAGGEQAFAVVVRDAFGNVNATASVAWSTNAGSITNAGLLTAQTTAESGRSVTATSGAASDTVAVDVLAAAPATVLVAPDGAGVTAGGTQAFTAVVRDAFGNVNSTATVAWSTDAGSIAADGTLTAPTTAATGRSVTATSGAASDSALFDVIAAAPATIVVSPDGPGVTAGGAQAFAAVVRDAFGNVNSTAPVAWSTNGGSITSGGVLTAQTTAASGRSVTATSGAASDSALFDVIAAAPSTLTVSPSGAGLPAGGSQAFTAVVRDAFGNVNGTASVAWSTNGGSITQGAVLTVQTSVASGKSVTATSGAASGSATFDVLPNQPASVVASPSGAGVTAGATQQYSAVVRDAYDNVNSTATVTWSTNAGSISGGGLLTAQTTAASGKTVTAFAGGVSHTVGVDVIAAAPDTVTVTPGVAGVGAGGTSPFSATVRDVYGNVNATASVAWSTNTGSITQGGLLTAPTTPVSGRTVTATSGGKSGTATVDVYAAAPASVTLSPTTATVNTTLTQQFTATARDAYSNVNSTATIAWSATRGTVSAAGLYTAPSTTGSDTVTATTNGQSASASVTVQKAIHIASIATYKNNASASTFTRTTDKVDARVRIVDHLGNGVGSVSVTLEWRRPNGNLDHTDTLTSVANGTADGYWTAASPTGVWTARVTSLSGTDLWWDTAADATTTRTFTVT